MDFTKFFNEQQNYLRKISLNFKRYLYEKINFSNDAIIITGQRGVGKTTILLQHLKENLKQNALYISVDNPMFQNISLYEFANEFEKIGGKTLLIDEIHKLSNWSNHIKTIIDQTSLKLIITGSSMLELNKNGADLSRRVSKYTLATMSFREFLLLKKGLEFEPISFKDLLENHHAIASELTQSFRPFKYFSEFLQIGAYPFFKDSSDIIKLRNVINQVIESDISGVCAINHAGIDKLKKLLFTLSTSVPFSPNIAALAASCELSRPTLLEYLSYLESSGLINMLNFKSRGYKTLIKPDKIYLNNSNLAYALYQSPDIGTLRETFFVNQMQNFSPSEQLFLSEKGDFLSEKGVVFEVGGKNKGFSQIKDEKNSFVVSDNVEVGFGAKIPLYLFGFLY